MSIRIRVDDFPQTKGEPQHTLEAFREFHRELTACTGVRYLLGVIPKRCTPEDLLFLARETDCDIGMHGIFHDEEKLDVWKNEFPPYLPQRDICRILQETAVALDNALGRRVDVYMPPRNLIDRKTVEVLLDAGFIAFTGGPETPVELRLAGNRDVEYLHSEPPFEYGRTDELLQRGAHYRLIEASEAGRDVILTLHWTWETNIGLSHMRSFLQRIPRQHFRDFHV